jgi:hypothetical protein
LELRAQGISALSSTFWAAPTMSADHLLFAVVTSPNIVVALQLEERDFVSALFS